MKLHFFTHSLVTVLMFAFIFALTNSPQLSIWAGSFMYLGREFAQWEVGQNYEIPAYQHFDWQGLIGPVLTSFTIYLLWN